MFQKTNKKPINQRAAILFGILLFTLYSCQQKSEYATESQLKMYDSLQLYMKQNRSYFVAEAITRKSEEAVEIMNDIMDKELEEVLIKHNFTKPEDMNALLMNMSVWVEIHKKKQGENGR
jgi:hypothetical protein